jgi:calcium binding protein 39
MYVIFRLEMRAFRGRYRFQLQITSKQTVATMLENQAFGWLKTAITLGGSENHTAIESCTDTSLLINGVSSDFEVIRSSDSAEESNEEVAKEPSSTQTNRQDITTRLDRIKTLLYEERSASSSTYAARGAPNYNWIPALATSTFKSFTSQDLITELIQQLTLLPFEARKSIAAIFSYLLVCGMDGTDARQFGSVSQAFGGYVSQRADVILTSLVKGHDCEKGSVDVTLLCGAMLRSCLRHIPLYQWILADSQCEELVYPFLERCVHNPNFDVSSDALETVRVMLTGSAVDGSGSSSSCLEALSTEEEQYKQTVEGIASEFLNRKYDEVIDVRMNKCLDSQSNYMTRRMTLQLLSTILLNRSNYNVMIRYISSSRNLVTILCLLRDPSPHITLDAFQVFKIFVANPSKPPEVIKILYDNKVKLIKYLEGLHKDREKSDEQFRDEKGLVIGTLDDLELDGVI